MTYQTFDHAHLYILAVAVCQERDNAKDAVMIVST